MRESEFRRALAQEFGESYSLVLLRDHWITQLQATAGEAIGRGVPYRTVWNAICADFDVPIERRYGRGLIEPKEK